MYCSEPRSNDFRPRLEAPYDTKNERIEQKLITGDIKNEAKEKGYKSA